MLRSALFLLVSAPALAGGASVAVEVFDGTVTDCISIGARDICITIDGVMNSVTTPSGNSHYLLVAEVLQEVYNSGTLASSITTDTMQVLHIVNGDGVYVSRATQCIDTGDAFYEYTYMYANGTELDYSFEPVGSCD